MFTGKIFSYTDALWLFAYLSMGKNIVTLKARSKLMTTLRIKVYLKQDIFFMIDILHGPSIVLPKISHHYVVNAK